MYLLMEKHNNEHIFVAQNLAWRDYSKCIHAHTHTQAPPHMSILLVIVVCVQYL